MKRSWVRLVGTAVLLGSGGATMAAAAGTGDSARAAHPQEPIGFVAGGVIGGFAAGPAGVVIGATLGTWLGERVHRAGEASRAEAQIAALRAETTALAQENAMLQSAKGELSATNRSLTVQVEQLSHAVQAAQAAQIDPAVVLDGVQGDVLFRTGSAEISAETAHQIEVLAQVVAKSNQLKVRLDGYADKRGTVSANLKLSEARADAVRDLLLAAGVGDQALEVNAYGKANSVADDEDGYALERRVRLTITAEGPASAADAGAPAGVADAPTAVDAPGSVDAPSQAAGQGGR